MQVFIIHKSTIRIYEDVPSPFQIGESILHHKSAQFDKVLNKGHSQEYQAYSVQNGAMCAYILRTNLFCSLLKYMYVLRSVIGTNGSYKTPKAL